MGGWQAPDSVVHRLSPHCRGALALLAAPTDPDLAVGMLDDVVASQWDAPGQPWNASFGGRPSGPVAWVDGWDPNMRSLVGLVLAVALESLGTRPAWSAALARAVRAEEATGRLTPSYGNIAAAHTACALAAATVAGDPSEADELRALGSSWLRAVEDDVDARGGWCEHASPTYAGVCLAALAGAAHWAPEGEDRERAERLARRAGQEISSAWSPVVGDLIGPFGRAYHARCADHVAVSGLALAGAGAGAAFPAPGARHAEDWGWAALLRHLGTARFVPGPHPPEGTGTQPLSWARRRPVDGFGTLTRFDSPDGPFAWGAVEGRAEDWHLQTVTASVHGGGAAAWLWHPALVAAADRDGIGLDVRPAGDGHPDWLWGRLQRPPSGLFRPPDYLPLRCSRPPVIDGHRVALPGAFGLDLEHPPTDQGLVKNGFGPPGFELRLPLVSQRIAVAPL